MIEELKFVTETLNHCHVPEERADLFHSTDTSSTEKEYLYLLHALVLCLKPATVLETGTFTGIGSMFIAKGLKHNGFGKLVSLEIDHKAAFCGREQLRINSLSNWADVVETDSLKFLADTNMTFDFALFDSALPLRCKELNICLERGLLKSGAMAALHDTSKFRTISDGAPDPQTASYWEELEAIEHIKFVQFPLSRGLTLAQVL